MSHRLSICGWGCVGVILCLCGTGSAQTPPPVFVHSWGEQGKGDGQFQSAQAVAVDESGNVYVADRDNHRVQKFGPSGAFILTWGGPGSEDGEFQWPVSIALDNHGGVYVVDQLNDRIQRFDSDGVFITKWGGSGTGEGEFDFPRDIATDDAGMIYVADFNNNRIQKFDSDGVFIMAIEFDAPPVAIDVDHLGNLYVIEQEVRVKKLTSNGVTLQSWVGFDSDDGRFAGAEDIAVDDNGNVYVTDTNNNRMQLFTSAGVFITKWGGGSGPGSFQFPRGVAVDGEGNIYVAAGNHIQRFMFLDRPPCPPGDLDGGCDVDLVDFGLFQSHVTGPVAPVLYVNAGFLVWADSTPGSYFSDENDLTAHVSQDGFGEDDFDMLWSVVSQPLGSGTVTIFDPAMAISQFVIAAPARAGDYVFNLSVSNVVTNDADEDTVTLNLVAP